jgi:hypothetical protein
MLVSRMHRVSFALGLGVALLSLAVAGCSSPSGPPRKACFPVSGQVTVKGKPAEGANVTLYPVEADSSEWAMGFPRGYVGPDGKFQIGTYTDNDGAPAGDYKVLISWEQKDPQNEESATDRLGGRYADPATTKLTAKVNAAPTELPPINLP